jgi:uncharacterized membrane protein
MEDCSIPSEKYKSSGKISLVRFLPLLMFSILVSIIMAIVLLFLEADFLYICFTPFLVSLPVFGVLFLLIHFGRCRNSIVGALAGLILTIQLYKKISRALGMGDKK